MSNWFQLKSILLLAGTLSTNRVNSYLSVDSQSIVHPGALGTSLQLECEPQGEKYEKIPPSGT
jgi:hypothetical protein